METKKLALKTGKPTAGFVDGFKFSYHTLAKKVCEDLRFLGLNAISVQVQNMSDISVENLENSSGGGSLEKNAWGWRASSLMQNNVSNQPQTLLLVTFSPFFSFLSLKNVFSSNEQQLASPPLGHPTVTIFLPP